MGKIGILGGSFDPVHQGHLNIAKSARQEFGLDEVWFIPAGHSPNKNEQEMTPAVDRMNMTKLAVAEYPYFRASSMEIDAAETSYTYRTLTRLTEQYPDTEFYFIMGADSLDYLERWKHPEIICEKAVILTAVRDNMDIVQIQEKISRLQELFPARIYPVKGGRTTVSSTEIRERISISGKRPVMLTEPVWAYIKKHCLYGLKTEESVESTQKNEMP